MVFSVPHYAGENLAQIVKRKGYDLISHNFHFFCSNYKYINFVLI